MIDIANEQEIAQDSIFDQIEALGHEQVVFCHDQHLGLKAIIAIHNTTLGPSLGGTRMWDYATDQEAVTDALRLSRGMTFKAAITGLNIGGGKAVIMGNPSKKHEVFMRRFGRFVDSLGGRYITAEDVNMKTKDMEFISMETDFVTGIPEIKGGSGDPSPVTAYGTYIGMKATAKKVYGTDSLEKKKIGVQGLGQVGSFLVDYLVKENAKVFIADIDHEKLRHIAEKHSEVVIIPEEDFYDLDMDIYAPCALGATLNDESIPKLRCKVVAGAANNQLADEKVHGRMLIEHGITYAPDFLINAGGLINVYMEYLGGYKKELAYAEAEKIYEHCTSILNKADREGKTTQEAAMEIAWGRIQEVGKLKLPY
jgi:leucine dehydrogenase